MQERLYYVYILASRSRILYTGMTSRLLERIAQHREDTVPGFTARYRIHRLVYFETYRDVRATIAREKQIKGWSGAKKIALIETPNPTWEDLAEDLFARSPRRFSDIEYRYLREDA
ncbi:MAG: GIY-YIG nuclease family protein [Candidatus Acidiferrum sp.]